MSEVTDHWKPLVQRLEAENNKLRRLAQSASKQAAERYSLALHDAIRRPMGVIPESAEGLVSVEELDAAERRRPKHDTRES